MTYIQDRGSYNTPRRGETSEEPWQRGLTPAPPNDDTDKLYAHVVIMFSDGACIAWAGERSQSLKEPLPLVEWPFLVVLFRGGEGERYIGYLGHMSST